MKKKPIQRIDIEKIENPEFLKNLNYKELNVLSNDICNYIVDATSKNGGHLSSNLGVVDSTIALCRVFDFSKDKIIFDVGHQCYTYKILTGRSLERLRQKDGISGFQKMSESPYDHFEAGHSSTSISVADGMAYARDLNKENYDVIAFIGDSSIANGLAFEGLNINGKSGNKIIIVLNDNGMSIGKPVGGLAKVFRNFSTSNFYRKSKHRLRRLFYKTKFGRKFMGGLSNIKNWFKRKLLAMNIFDTLGFSVIGPVDGHNIKAMEKAFERAKKIDKSVVIHIKTIKGKGYPFAENDKKGVWHGVGKFNKETGVMETKSDLWSWSEIYKDGILYRMRDDKDALCVVPATGLGSSLGDVFEEFPRRILDVGISEEHAMTMAGGLAASGKKPIISIYSTFLQRTYDQISHDIARVGLNATILVDRAGLVGNDGDTHQGIYDEAILMSIPNTVVAMASTVAESKALIEESKNDHGVFCIRYPRDYADMCEDTELIPFGTWKIANDSSSAKTAIVSVGPDTEKLRQIIINNNIDVKLINALYQKPMDMNVIKSLNDFDKVIIYNSTATAAGFANALCAELIKNEFKGKIIVKTVPDQFVKQATIDEQKAEFGLLPEDILKLI